MLEEENHGILTPMAMAKNMSERKKYNKLLS